MPRTATVKRKTRETDIQLELTLDPPDDQAARYHHDTGVGFLDHMLDHVARHGRFGLTITAKGDTHVDDHHTVEDVGLALGQALLDALGDKRGIERFGFASVPMDEALARVSVDLSGRPALVLAAPLPEGGKIGSFDIQLIGQFLTAAANAGRFNCNVEVPAGSNHHHIAEAIFKAFGRALRQAVALTGADIPSTKGVL